MDDLGAYIEETSEGKRTWPRWSNLMRATDRHRITISRLDTLTLVLAASVVRSWGFHTPSGWVPWREYNPT